MFASPPWKSIHSYLGRFYKFCYAQNRQGGLAMMDFLGDLLGDFFFFLPKGNLTISFSLLGDFLLGDFFLGDFLLGKRIRSGGTLGGDTCGDTWSGDACGDA